MMSAPLRTRISKEAAEQKLLQTYKLAQVRTELNIEEVSVLERADSLLHLRARVSRTKSRILDGSGPVGDRLEVDIVERVVPRSIDKPDGLELADFSVRAANNKSSVNGERNAAGLPESGNAP